MSLISHTTPIARKRYTCEQCFTWISQGEKHSKTVGTWDDFRTYREHLDCARAAYDYHSHFDHHPDDGVCLANDLEWDDFDWLADRHPSVAIRFNAVVTPYF